MTLIHPKNTNVEYWVRKPGLCYWSSSLSLAQAMIDLKVADSMCGPGHDIIAAFPDGRTVCVAIEEGSHGMV